LGIKLIVMDMDGTLLGADHVAVPARNISALRRAKEKGVKLAIASGRTWSLIGDAVEQLGGIDYAILANGAAVRNVETGEHIYENAIPNPQAKELIRRLSAVGLPCEIYCRGQNYAILEELEQLKECFLSPEFEAQYRAQTRFVSDLAEALDGRPMEKINMFYAPPEYREKLCAEAMAAGPVAITNALEGNMEFARGGASKGLALQALAKHLGLDAREIMAFGDANNDLEMLRWAFWSFAMANGTAEARSAGRYIAPANVEAGVGQMVEKYVLEG